MTLTAGDIAPDFEFNTPVEKNLRFYEQKEGLSSILVFLRYYGCPVCRMHMDLFESSISMFKEKEASVFVALQSDFSGADDTAFRDRPYSIICDPGAAVYRLYNVKPGGVVKYLNPAGLVSAIKATGKGYRHGKFEGKETQTPAAFVISPDNSIRYAHYGRHIGDLPSPAFLAERT